MINYTVIPKKNPITKAVKYYGFNKVNGQISLDTICEQIAEECSLTTADVKACLDRLQRQIRLQLMAGNSVSMGDLGSFRATLKTKGVDTQKDFTVDQIENVRIRFKASRKLREAMKVDAVTFKNTTKEAEANTPNPGQ